MPEISLIICVYKNIVNLDLILRYINKQTFQNFEVIVAEDNNASEMFEFIEHSQKNYSFQIKHVYQEDLGFLKCRILNQALRISEGNMIVFLDGDCLPHCQFLEQYSKALIRNKALVGRRVMLTQNISEKTLKGQRITFLNLLLARCTHLEEGIYLPFLSRFKNQARGIWGCNWGILKEHLLDINGFDEDYTQAGNGEDTDIEWRLRKIGIKLQSMKFKAIVYHLFHEVNYQNTFPTDQLLKEKQRLDQSFCINGIKKINAES